MVKKKLSLDELEEAIVTPQFVEAIDDLICMGFTQNEIMVWTGAYIIFKTLTLQGSGEEGVGFGKEAIAEIMGISVKDAEEGLESIEQLGLISKIQWQ